VFTGPPSGRKEFHEVPECADDQRRAHDGGVDWLGLDREAAWRNGDAFIVASTGRIAATLEGAAALVTMPNAFRTQTR